MTSVYLGRDARKAGLALGRMLGEGASGKVYAVPGKPGFAAKLYHDEAEAKKHEAKIDLMLGNPPDLPALEHGTVAFPQLAWPEAKLYDSAGRFIGFLMPEIDFRRSTSLVNVLQKSSRRAEKISEYYGYRVLVARNLASVFAELHRAGHHMIDMKPANLRFYPSVSWMAVVDTDGFSIAGAARRVPAEQVSDEYIAPESWQKQPSELGVEQDLFALATIIFQLLNNGVHPFAGSAARGSSQATDLQARIQEGLYPYGAAPNSQIGPSTASIHRSFRRSTRALFDRAFVPGDARPTAAEWRDHLDELVDELVPCAAKPNEHAHFGGGCGFCGHDARVEAAARKAKPRPRPRTVVARPATSRLPPGAAGPSNVIRLPLASHGRVPRRPIAPPFRRVPPKRFQMPRAAFKWWQSWPLLLLFAVLLLSSEDVWRRISPAAAAGLRAAGFVTMVDPQAQPDLAAYDQPREYRVKATPNAAPVALHAGPGDRFRVIDQLTLRDDVIGHGETKADDGSPWIWVTRGSDGQSGYVRSAALLLAPQPANGSTGCTGSPNDSDVQACHDPQDTPLHRALAARYRGLLDRATGYERVYLIEDHQLWLDQRTNCRLQDGANECLAEIDRQRAEKLHDWKGLKPKAGDEVGGQGATTAAQPL